MGKAVGVDGQVLKLGSVKLDSLVLGKLSVPDPVFTVTTGATGLFNNKSIGVLGTPFWSRFVVTLDYSHRRIILERPEEGLYGALEESARIRRQYLKSHDFKDAADQLRNLMDKTKSPVLKVIYRTSLASCLGDQALRTKEKEAIKLAHEQFLLAINEAGQCPNKTAEARAKSRFALFSEHVDSGALAHIQDLLQSARQADPVQPDLCAGQAWSLLKTDPAGAQALLDQALVLEPDNWDALLLRRQLAHEQNKPEEEALVVAQMQRYYGPTAEVENINNK